MATMSANQIVRSLQQPQTLPDECERDSHASTLLSCRNPQPATFRGPVPGDEAATAIGRSSGPLGAAASQTQPWRPHDLLRLLTSAPEVRADAIRQLHERP